MNRKLLGNSKILEILVDSESIDTELNEDNEAVKRVLKYFVCSIDEKIIMGANGLSGRILRVLSRQCKVIFAQRTAG